MTIDEFIQSGSEMLMERFPLLEERIALRAALKQAAYLCDTVRSDMAGESKPYRGAELLTAGNKILAMSDLIEVPDHG